MSENATYHTIAAAVSVESKVKGSRFTGHAAPVEKREAAEKYVGQISEKFRDATHNCFAYKIGVGDEAISRASDAGEPAGSAGKPILQAIEGKGLTQVAVVVTRYFGGTKLGIGGLRRAYGGAAQLVLERATIVEHKPMVTLMLEFDYHLGNAVHGLLDKFKGEVLNSDFEERTLYQVSIPAEQADLFRQELQDISSGRISIHSLTDSTKS